MEKNITAYEFIKERYDWSNEDLERWSDAMSKLPMADFNNVIDLMVEFAKIKVESALQSAANQKTYGMLVIPLFNEEQQKSILNAYPYEKIQ